MTIKQRLMAKAKVNAETGCWDWTGGTVTGGYGSIWHNGKTRRAHRVAYQVFCGPVTDAQDVCHKCDNPGCINPAHLFAGTTAENIADMFAKGRNSCSRGSDQHLSKLTENDVVAIRSAEGITQRELAKRYGVHLTVISKVRRREIWKHI
jgi:hypothetical protein